MSERPTAPVEAALPARPDGGRGDAEPVAQPEPVARQAPAPTPAGASTAAAVPALAAVPRPVDRPVDRPVAQPVDAVASLAGAGQDGPRPTPAPGPSAGAMPGGPRPVPAEPRPQGPGGPVAFAVGIDDGRPSCTVAQLRRFIKSRPWIPLHELRRRFGIYGGDDDVSPIRVGGRILFIGLPPAESRLMAELLDGGDVGYELSLDPGAPIVVGVYPMRPVPRG